jgi:hypothetical protein
MSNAGQVAVRFTWLAFYSRRRIKNCGDVVESTVLVEIKPPPGPNWFVAITVQFATGNAGFVEVSV